MPTDIFFGQVDKPLVTPTILCAVRIYMNSWDPLERKQHFLQVTLG